MTTAMSKEEQEQKLVELISVYMKKERESDNPLDVATIRGFGASVVKAFLETDILSISPEKWTAEVKNGFVKIALANVKECLNEISATWTAEQRATLFSHFDNRDDYILGVLGQLQVKLAHPEHTTVQ